jgi:hypothetical protein
MLRFYRDFSFDPLSIVCQRTRLLACLTLGEGYDHAADIIMPLRITISILSKNSRIVEVRGV